VKKPKITPSDHARLSPSGSKRWLSCAGSLVLEAPYPNKSNAYSDEGTACHEIAARCLRQGIYARKFVGEFVPVHKSDEEPRFVQFTDDMVDLTQPEVDAVRAIGASAVLTLIEHKADFSEVVQIPGQFGTLDVGLVLPLGDGTYELVILDFKFGHTPVEAEHNTQLLIYALALYQELSISYEFTSVRLIIRQPKYRHSEFCCSATYLTGAFADRLRSGAISTVNAENDYGVIPMATWEQTYLNQQPNEKDCAYCRAMAVCPSYNRAVQAAVGADFQIVTDGEPTPLTTRMQAVPLVEEWCRAVRAEMEGHLIGGGTDPQFGLELGRKGPRQWKAPEEVVHYLRASMKLKKELVYEYKLKSPTQIEKLTKPSVVVNEETKQEEHIGPLIKESQWKKLCGQITQSDAKPSVKLLSDIKVPYKVPVPDAGDFQAVDELW